MKYAKIMHALLFSLILCATANAFTHSCEDLRNNYMGSNFVSSLTYACVVVQEGFSNWVELSDIYLSAELKYSLAYIAKSSSHCVQHSWDTSWTLTSELGKSFSCTQEFTLILSSLPPPLSLPLAQERAVTLHGYQTDFVVPQTGIKLHKQSCTGGDSVAIFTGAGFNESELLYEYKSWPCASVPDWIVSFDIVDTVRAFGGASYSVEYSSDVQSIIVVSPGDKIAVLSSGKSNDQQNFIGIDNRATFMIANDGFADVTVNMDLSFASKSTASVVIQTSFDGPTNSYYSGNSTATFSTDYFEVRYVPNPLSSDYIYRDQDTIIVEISIGKQASTVSPAKTTTTKTIVSTSTAAVHLSTDSQQPLSQGPYCSCAVDKFGFPDGWNYNDIWLDVVFILDTSEAMSQESINDAGALIESFISDGEDDFLITDQNAPLYSRIGVISMSDTSQVLYNLNMSKVDKVEGKVTVKKGVQEIDVVDAFNAAQNMLDDGASPDRAYTRQVVYYVTHSDANKDLSSLDDFKASKGVIIVNNFLQDGETARPGLTDLASDGYYFSTSNYMQGLQAFCKANCFCKPGKDSYGGSDIAIKAAGGCYHATSAGVPFNKAKSSCSTEGGILAADHDTEKGKYLQQLMAKASSKSDYFWIGYEKSDDGDWQWEDQSTDPYTNWDKGEPNGAAVAKCAYVDTTSSALPWGAGNCQLGFPYICQYAPCSVGYKDC